MTSSNTYSDYQPLFDSPYSKGPVAPLNRKSRAKGCAKLNNLSPSSFSGTTSFTSQGMSIFTISDVDLDLVDKWWLQFTVTNGDANPLTLVSTHFFIQRLEVYCNGNCVETIYPYMLYYRDLLHTNMSASLLRGSQLNYSANLTNGAITSGPPIASGSSATLFLDFNTVLDRSGVNFRYLKMNNTLELRVYLNSVANIVYGNVLPAVDPTLTQLQLWVPGVELSPEERGRQFEKYRTKGFSGLSTISQSLVLPIQTLSANQIYTFIMTGITGRMCSITMGCQPTSPTQGSDLMTLFTSFLSIALLDSSGSPYDVTGIWQNLEQVLEVDLFGGTFLIFSQPLWYRNLAPDPISSEFPSKTIGGSNPAIRGGCNINNSRIQFTTGSVVPGTNQSLYISFLQHANVSIPPGSGKVKVDML